MVQLHVSLVVKCTESVWPQEISPLVRLVGLISGLQKGKLDECAGSLDLSIIDNGVLSGGSLFICQCETDVGREREIDPPLYQSRAEQRNRGEIGSAGCVALHHWTFLPTVGLCFCFLTGWRLRLGEGGNIKYEKRSFSKSLLTSESNTLSPYLWELSSRIPKRVSRVSCRNCSREENKGSITLTALDLNLTMTNEIKSGNSVMRIWSWTYFDNLRAVDLLQLREAVVDPLRVGSPLQQVQHITWRRYTNNRSRRFLCLFCAPGSWEGSATKITEHHHTLQLQPPPQKTPLNPNKWWHFQVRQHKGDRKSFSSAGVPRRTHE